MTNYNIGYLPVVSTTPIDYTPASDVQIAVYGMIANGTAFNTTPQQNAAMLQQIATDLLYVLMYLEGVSPNVKALAAAADQASALNAHLSDQYTNLIDNLQLVSSGISDAIGYGIIGTPGAPAGSIDNPTASYTYYFGSILGGSDTLVSQATNQIVALMAHACALIAGAIITTLQASSDARVVAALGTLNDPTALVAAMGNLTQANLNLMSAALTNLGTLLASGDPSLASLSGILPIAVSLNLATYTPTGSTASTTSTDGG